MAETNDRRGMRNYVSVGIAVPPLAAISYISCFFSEIVSSESPLRVKRMVSGNCSCRWELLNSSVMFSTAFHWCWHISYKEDCKVAGDSNDIWWNIQTEAWTRENCERKATLTRSIAYVRKKRRCFPTTGDVHCAISLRTYPSENYPQAEIPHDYFRMLTCSHKSVYIHVQQTLLNVFRFSSCMWQKHLLFPLFATSTKTKILSLAMLSSNLLYSEPRHLFWRVLRRDFWTQLHVSINQQHTAQCLHYEAVLLTLKLLSYVFREKKDLLSNVFSFLHFLGKDYFGNHSLWSTVIWNA
jgi:hypothetical protein